MTLAPAQLRHLEGRLQEERRLAQALLDRVLSEWSVGGAVARAGDLTAMPLHPADRGTDANREEVEATNADRVSRELAESDAALARVYESPGDFGHCINGGGDIPFEHLDVIPWARTCAQAERRER